MNIYYHCFHLHIQTSVPQFVIVYRKAENVAKGKPVFEAKLGKILKIKKKRFNY